MEQANLRQPIKVMIAEDDLLYRTSIRQFFSGKSDIQILGEADNGQHLLDLMETAVPDVILLDVHMPVLDGSSALRLIRKHYPDTKVIILSVDSKHSMISQFMNDGAYAYLSKSFGAEMIYQTVYGSMSDRAGQASDLQSELRSENR